MPSDSELAMITIGASTAVVKDSDRLAVAGATSNTAENTGYQRLHAIEQREIGEAGCAQRTSRVAKRRRAALQAVDRRRRVRQRCGYRRSAQG